MRIPIVQRVVGKYRRFAAERLAQRPWVMRNRTPIISFTFDDFPASALHTAGKILEEHGFAGTYYTSAGLLGTVAPTGPILPAEELPLVIERGHEIGCHTHDHCPALTTRPAIFEASIAANRQAMQRLVPGVKMESLSYPIGSPKPGTKRRAGRHFAGCRDGGQIHNVRTMDLRRLKGYFIEQSSHAPEQMEDAIRKTCDDGGWLIFATHDVAPDHTRYGCTPEIFARVVEAAARSGARVLPVSAGLRETGALQ